MNRRRVCSRARIEKGGAVPIEKSVVSKVRAAA